MKKITLLILIILPCILFSQTHTWTGNGSDQDFANPNNWDVLTEPDENSNVLISGDFDVLVSGASIVADLALESQAKLTVEGELETQEINLFDSVVEVNGSLTGNGIFSIDKNSQLDFLSGEIINAIIMNFGTIEVTDLTNHDFDGVTIENDGLFQIFESNQVNFLTSTFVNNPDGVFNIQSNGGFTEQATNSILDNNGLLRKTPIAGSSNGAFYIIMDINNGGTIDIAENETFLFLVTSNTFENGPSGRIIGEGTFDITAQFVNEGHVEPADGGAIGTLDFTNTFNLTNTGFLYIDIMGSFPGEFDEVNILGSPTLEANIDVNVMQELTIGDSFKVITWSQSGATCNFPQSVITNFGGTTYTFDIICNPNDVTLELADAVLSTEDFNVNELAMTVNPNPVDEQTTFYFSSEVIQRPNIELRVLDILGQPIFTDTKIKATYQFNRNNLSSGVYFAQIISNGKVLLTEQLILN